MDSNIDDEVDLLGFDVNSTFTKDTREDLGDVEVLESEHKLPKVRPNLLSFAPGKRKASPHVAPQSTNKYLKKATSGHVIEKIQTLVKCFGPTSCKENEKFIIAQIPGCVGKLVLNKAKILANLKSNILEDDIIPEETEDQNTFSHDHDHSESSGLVSMDWDKINEEHKVENRDEIHSKIVDKICEIWKDKMGCDGNSAMIHKWLVQDKLYTGPNAGPDFILEMYWKAIEDLFGNEYKTQWESYLKDPETVTEPKIPNILENSEKDEIKLEPENNTTDVTRETNNDNSEVENQPRPVLRSAGMVANVNAGPERIPTIDNKNEKPTFDFGDLEDMDDMLLDELDSEEMEEDYQDEEQEQVKDELTNAFAKFNSENVVQPKSKISENSFKRALSVNLEESKYNRTVTDVNTPKIRKQKGPSNELDLLREQLAEAYQEIEQYQNFLIQIQQTVNWNNVDMSQAKVHMSFLFASPLLRKVQNSYENVMLLDYLSEIRYIENNLKNVKYEVKYNKNVATLRNFHSVVSDRPIILHFSGHGVVNDKQSLGADWAFNKDKGNILLLEDEHGMSQYLFENDLKTMINMMEAKFEVVFVASCHSEFAGKVFCNAGATHVICIRGDEKISDQATLQFAQVFYEMLFVKQYSPCKAFQITKEEVKHVNCAAEAEKFILLTSDEELGKKHECNPLINFKPGKFTQLQQNIAKYHVPAPITSFSGRQREMYDIICLLHKNKIVSLLGEPGLGKTALLNKICNHMRHRDRFTNGIVYVDMEGIETVDNLIDQIYTCFNGVIDSEKFKKSKTEPSEIIVQIATYISDKEVLVVFDNGANLASDPEFIDIVKKLYKNCDKSRILISSTDELTELAHLEVTNYDLKKISDDQALKLMLDKSPRTIPTTEIKELVMATEGCKNLMSHPLTQHLNGHPKTIIDFALSLKEKTLLEMYKSLQS